MTPKAGTAQAFAGTEKVVTITVKGGGKIEVDKNTILLSKARGDRASWRREGEGPFKIIFRGVLPLGSLVFDQDHAKNLAPDANAPLDTYKYTVQVPGCDDLDPEVIVDQ